MSTCPNYIHFVWYLADTARRLLAESGLAASRKARIFSCAVVAVAVCKSCGVRWQKNAFREFFTKRIGVWVCYVSGGGLGKAGG